MKTATEKTMEHATDHFRKLEKMYLGAPINKFVYTGIEITISDQKAVIQLGVDSKLHHAAHAIHGSVYFKLLDDAAFFAVNSVVPDVFVYTVSFNIQLLRPVSSGIIISTGELKFKSNNLFIADSTLLDENKKLLGKGSGSFMRSKIHLTENIGYK
jgi:uncharacterized protein (TIGR00369 family)